MSQLSKMLTSPPAKGQSSSFNIIPGSMTAKGGKTNPYSYTSPQAQRMAKTSPFHVPNDEEIFLQREAEKAKFEELKQLSRGLRIWDKPTANSRSPLKRIRDNDIPPASLDDGAFHYNYNSAQRGYISAAMNIAKSRGAFNMEPLPGGKTKQDIHDFINQKKEMFMVELSQNVIQ